MKILYLHIGAGKTGTSVLQTQFAINKKVLEQHNIFLDFIHNILNIENSDSFNTENKRVNRSLTKHELTFMRYINIFFKNKILSTFVSNTLICTNPASKIQAFNIKKRF